MAKKCVSRILWPLDPFGADDSDQELIQRRTTEALRGFAAATESRIEPVYVLTPRQLNLGIDAPAKWLQKYKPVAEAAMRNFFRANPVPGISRCRVLMQATASTSAAIKTLGKYANSSGADMIFIGTHGRKGVPRLFLGSFAETLLFESRIPVLVVNPKVTPVTSYRHILFATDLGRASFHSFRKALGLACQLRARITIFHSIQNPAKSAFHGGSLMGTAWIAEPTFVEDELAARRKVAARWLKAAAKYGVAVDLDLRLTEREIVPSILDAAERCKTGMIALTAQTGPLASAVLGSVTRQVIREASQPVWVLRAHGAKS